MGLAKVIDFLTFKKRVLEIELEDALEDGRDGAIEQGMIDDLLKIDGKNPVALTAESAKLFIGQRYRSANSKAVEAMESDASYLPALKMYLASGLVLLEQGLLEMADYEVHLNYYLDFHKEDADANILRRGVDYLRSRNLESHKTRKLAAQSEGRVWH